MSVSRRKSLAATVALAASAGSLALSVPAQAAPITVNVRIEGSSATLFEGPVTTEAILGSPGLTTESSEGAHPCDVKDNGLNEGFAAAAANPTTALYTAASESGLAFNAKWSAGMLNDFFITRVGNDLEGGPPEYPAWGYAVDFGTAHVGGCQFQLAPGSEVLWAYNYFNLSHLLKLAAPTSVSLGVPFTVHVVDGQDGEPLAGASIGELLNGATSTIAGSAVTDASGNATVTLTHAGAITLKATRAASVRSNGVAVCVHNGNDGTCGTTVSSPVKPNEAKILGIENGHIYGRHSGPRVLRGAVTIPAGGTLRDIRIRLERNDGGHCFNFNGSKAAFVRAKKCGTALYFTVGNTQSFSYLLPARLPAGRYLYEIEAVDIAGQVTKPAGGVSDVVFRVR